MSQCVSDAEPRTKTETYIEVSSDSEPECVSAKLTIELKEYCLKYLILTQQFMKDIDMLGATKLTVQTDTLTYELDVAYRHDKRSCYVTKGWREIVEIHELKVDDTVTLEDSYMEPGLVYMTFKYKDEETANNEGASASNEGAGGSNEGASGSNEGASAST